ncbi:MAG: hypothetical protein JSS86_00675 [Cyanobacteria bacterium SZAS LIN-2]|nr:hypothetical protein [Cyanobacteria bacterium SZAS LIN-2]
MPTSSLKLSADLRKCVAAAAQRRGMTAHAFMMSAIEESVRTAELRASFVAQAQRARKAAIRSGKGYDAGEVHEYLHTRIKDRTTVRPKCVAWRG